APHRTALEQARPALRRADHFHAVREIEARPARAERVAVQDLEAAHTAGHPTGARAEARAKARGTGAVGSHGPQAHDAPAGTAQAVAVDDPVAAVDRVQPDEELRRQVRAE